MWKMFILNKKGITLAETLVSAFIISLVFISVITIFVQTVTMSKRVDYEYNGTNLAKSRIERAKAIIASRGFDALPDLEETDTEIDIDSDGDSDFRRSTDVTTNYNDDSRLTMVEVNVVYNIRGEWKEGAAITMSTIFADIETE